MKSTELIFALDAAVRSVCPLIDGVSSDGVISFQDAATPSDREAANAVVLNFDPAKLPPPPVSILSQDLMAQLTVADYSAIKGAVTSSDAFGLLWASLQAQSDPMIVTNPRFLVGWSALVSVLGQTRMGAVATALSITVGTS